MPRDEVELIADYLAAPDHGSVEWTEDPWRSALPCLRWLRVVPNEILVADGTRALGAPAMELLAAQMASRFVSDSGELAWSSYYIQSALDAMASSSESVPEALLRALWEVMGDIELSENSYQFSRAVGRELLGGYQGDSAWDLGWMLADARRSQIVFRFWSIAVKPHFWSDELDEEVVRVLGPLGFDG